MTFSGPAFSSALRSGGAARRVRCQARLQPRGQRAGGIGRGVAAAGDADVVPVDGAAELRELGGARRLRPQADRRDRHLSAPTAPPRGAAPCSPSRPRCPSRRRSRRSPPHGRCRQPLVWYWSMIAFGGLAGSDARRGGRPAGSSSATPPPGRMSCASPGSVRRSARRPLKTSPPSAAVIQVVGWPGLPTPLAPATSSSSSATPAAVPRPAARLHGRRVGVRNRPRLRVEFRLLGGHLRGQLRSVRFLFRRRQFHDRRRQARVAVVGRVGGGIENE